MLRAASAFRLATCLILLVAASLTGSSAWAQEAPTCTAQYETAEQHYYNGAFDEALPIIEQCLERPSLSGDLRVRFHRLLAFVHLARSAPGKARMAVETLLELRPDYTPDPVEDPPNYVSLVKEVKEARSDQNQDRGWMPWALAGAGTVLTGVLAAVLIGRSSNGNGNGGNGNDGLLPPFDDTP